jgi:hypothetical protein
MRHTNIVYQASTRRYASYLAVRRLRMSPSLSSDRLGRRRAAVGVQRLPHHKARLR